jgi:glycerol-3-phosphate dehydrogenase
LRNAPHLANPLPLLTPVFSAIEGLYITIGLTLYDLIAGQDSLPKGRWLNRAQALSRMPTLTPRMHSAVLYYDGQLNDARYALALAHSADEAGATVANYVAITGFKGHNGRIETAIGRDELTGETFPIRARLFLNCTGPYADAIRLLANPDLEQRIRPSKGVHIVLPRETLQSDCAMLIPKTDDGRVVFAIPFGDKVFVGTTDDDYTDLDREPALEPQEVTYLLDTLRPYLAKTPDKADVQAGFGGIRPLIVSSRADTKTLLRDHEVEYDAKSNLLSLLGGKWTTYRLMAQDAIDRVGELLGKSAVSTTENHYLVGGEQYRFDDWQKLQRQYGLPTDVCQHLMQTYGNRAERVAELTQEQPHFAYKLTDSLPFLNAEVVYQVRQEMAVKPRDVLARRWRVELSDWQLSARLTPQVVELMAAELGWTDTTSAEQIAFYQALLASFATQAGLSNRQQELARA